MTACGTHAPGAYGHAHRDRGAFRAAFASARYTWGGLVGIGGIIAVGEVRDELVLRL